MSDWRLALTSDLDLAVLAYIRTSDRFLTSMHDLAPSADGVHRVATFNPGNNVNQESRLRLVNRGAADAPVAITGTDDASKAAGPVRLTGPVGASCTVTASELETGGDGLDGALGDGVPHGSFSAGMALKTWHFR